MRIAYICADQGVPVFGEKGSSIHVQEVLRALQREGAEVELFAANIGNYPPPPDFQLSSINRLQNSRYAEIRMRERAALAANHDLHAILEREGPFDLVYERYSLWSFAGMEYARSIEVPGILEVNSPLIGEQSEHRILMDCDSAEKVARQAFNAADVLIAVSNEVAEYVKCYMTTSRQVHVMPNGVNPDRFPLDIRPSLPDSPGTFTVGFVGTLKPWHGMPTLVDAFAILTERCPNARLLIVGHGPERKTMTEDLSKRGLLDRTYFTGPAAPDEVPGFLASMDAAVAPYSKEKRFYFSPLKVYEYMAAGLPVVASRVGQLTELIQDGINGILCSPGDPIEMALAIDRLRCDSDLRARLGRAARAKVLQNHTWSVIVHRTLLLAGIDQVSHAM